MRVLPMVAEADGNRTRQRLNQPLTGFEDRYRQFSLQRSVFRHCAKVHTGQGFSPASPWSLPP